MHIPLTNRMISRKEFLPKASALTKVDALGSRMMDAGCE